MSREECPLCGGIADCTGVNFNRWKKYRCDRCSVFVITPSAVGKIAIAEQNHRDIISDESRECKTGTVLWIHPEESTGNIVWKCEPEDRWT